MTYNAPFVWAVWQFSQSITRLSIVQENLWIGSDTDKDIARGGIANILDEFGVRLDCLGGENISSSPR